MDYFSKMRLEMKSEAKREKQGQSTSNLRREQQEIGWFMRGCKDVEAALWPNYREGGALPSQNPENSGACYTLYDRERQWQATWRNAVIASVAACRTGGEGVCCTHIVLLRAHYAIEGSVEYNAECPKVSVKTNFVYVKTYTLSQMTGEAIADDILRVMQGA